MRYLIVFLFLIYLSACVGPVKELKYQIEDSWDSEPATETPTELSDVNNEKNIETLWSTNIGSESSWVGENKPTTSNVLDIFPFENFIFTLNHDGKMKKIDANDGKIIWEKAFDTTVTAGVSGNSDYLFFVSNEGLLWCVNHDGKELWKTYVGGQVFVSPLANSTFVSVRLNYNKFVQINSLDGSVKWQYQAGTPPLSINQQGKMTYGDGVIYSGLPEGKLIAIEAQTGMLIWEASVAQPKGITEIERVNDITSQPIIDGPVVFSISSNAGKIVAIDRRSSQSLWDRPLSSFVGINLNGGDIIVVHESNSIYSLDANEGKTNWRNADLQYRNIGKGAIAGDYLIVGDFIGYLHFIDLKSGKITNRIRMSDSQIVNNILVLNDRKIIAMDINGNVHCLTIN